MHRTFGLLVALSWLSLGLLSSIEPGAGPFAVRAQAPAKAARNAAKKAGTKGAAKGRPATVGPAVRENKATPIDRIKVPAGFQVELVYSVPGSDQGSWVNLCVDPRGRIIASDQYGGLYRFTPPAPGQTLTAAQVEKLPLDIRAVNGMAFAFGALYLGVNDYENKIPSGLYRAVDSDGDQELDKVELLRAMEARGDHGVHAVIPTPDGEALYLVCGNGTRLTEFHSASPVPAIWGEDHILPRMPDGRGFMRDVLGPGGIIYRVSPDGKDFSAVACGFRNIFDASLNHLGDLFTYDADMEYDFNTSWYRPTRICQVVSGAEYGWRNGAGKRPEFYADNLPPVLNIGPGSPTGTTFGYGARFPAKYQRALFVLDWSWGKIYAVHLQPAGATYAAEKEEFVTGAPFPVTDAVIHPTDGAMYVAIGGRRVQSGLYRITYAGSEMTETVALDKTIPPLHQLRRRLEAFHGRSDRQALTEAWTHLGHEDRFIRWAARTAIEHQPWSDWAEPALAEKEPARLVEALLALGRAAGVCPSHRKSDSPPLDAALGRRLIDAYVAQDWRTLSRDQQLTYFRGLEIALHRFGPHSDETVARVIAHIEPAYPADGPDLNWLLCETLVYLQSPQTAEKTLQLIAAAPTQEEQIEYARSLRMLRSGWTMATRTAYFEWLLKAANYRGGASFDKFIEFIRTDALATLTDAERETLRDLLARQPQRTSPLENFGQMFAGRPQTSWTLDQLADLAASGLNGRDFHRGRKLFGAAACFACHRFGNEGGMTGPDLTSAGRRFAPRDLLDQILNPSKVINDQFVPTDVITLEGELYRGVIVNLSGDTITLNTDAADPNQRKTIDRKEVERMEISKVSPMPTNLLSPLTQDEILDLLAYLISGGDATHSVFQKPGLSRSAR